MRIFSITVLFLVVFVVPLISNAETHIKSGDLDRGGSWTKEGSPYILDEGVYIPRGYTLSIKDGVTVMSASSTDEYGEINTLTFDGNLSVEGTVEDPVIFDNLYSLYFSHSNVNIKNGVFDNTGLDFWLSTSTILDTKIKNSQKGVSARGSTVNISKSQIFNNTIGIASYLYEGVYQAHNDTLNGYGGIGNALDIIDPEQNQISITNSSITNNSQYGIINQTPNTVDAVDIWWGHGTGPRTEEVGIGDRIFGPINFSPWKDKDPGGIQVCCSNVLFIPGLEASILEKEHGGLFGTSTNRLWEPNRNADVEKLYLDQSGKSIDKDIYTTKIMESAYGVKSIYKSFVAMINGVVADKVINEWLPYPYDWRMNIDEIVYGETKVGTSTISLIESVEKLASNSKTGKIIIITHSNGGLVSKLLLKALSEQGKADLVEKVINIAVPELGTPQSILAMLHGHNQSIIGGMILSKKTARNLTQNMPSAYGLLPTKEFFARNPLTVISDMFSSGLGIKEFTYDGMKRFLLGNSFSVTSTTDTNTPLLLNAKLLAKSESMHTIIDTWRASTSTNILSLIGWGMPTSSGIEYKKDEHCKDKKGKGCSVYFSPIVSNAGDGTVLTNSNAGLVDRQLFINLDQIKRDTKKEIEHANILESIDVLDVIDDQIKNRESTKVYSKYITETEPVDHEKWLTVKVFSPVDIHVYDKEGNHTGPIENPIPGKDLEPFENHIAGGYYGDFDAMKMIRVPYDDYQIELKGTDIGMVIVKAEVSQYDTVLASTTFAELPVTPLFNAELFIPKNIYSLATSSVMYIDNDGNGIAEITQNTEEYLSKNKSPFKKNIKKSNKILKKYWKKSQI
jgi:hypothetical protein